MLNIKLKVIPPIFHLLFEFFALKLDPKFKSMCLDNNYMGHERAINLG